MTPKVIDTFDVRNQYVIKTDEGLYFQSYSSIIAFKPNNGSAIQLGPDWGYSRTTGKYRNQFLNETTAETRKKLADGTYILNEDL